MHGVFRPGFGIKARIRKIRGYQILGVWENANAFSGGSGKHCWL